MWCFLPYITAAVGMQRFLPQNKAGYLKYQGCPTDVHVSFFQRLMNQYDSTKKVYPWGNSQGHVTSKVSASLVGFSTD